MKAIVIEEFGGTDKLRYKEMEKPSPQDDEVLIKVAYAGVNPVDFKIREGYLSQRLPHDFPIILGWDVSGTVVEIGKKVKDLKVGDEVYAYVRKPLVKWGTYTEYVAFEAKNIAKKPTNVSFAEAAALPLVSLTAWQSVFDAAHLKKGETILILASSGGVGSMAVQFAKNIDAKVFATASPKKHDYVKKLGADVTFDYHSDFVNQVKEGVDVIFDCFGGDSFTKSLSCLKKGGRSVSILEHLDPDYAKRLGITASYVFVAPNGDQLRKIAHLIEEEKVVCPHVEEMKLQDVAFAQEKLSAGNVFGKIVLKVS